MRPFTLWILVAAWLASVVAVASAAEPPDSSRTNSLRPGSWSLQFEIGEDFQLESFQGAVLSIKRHRSAKTAFRLGLGFGINFDDEDYSSWATEADTTQYLRDSEFTSDDEHLELTLEYLNYPNPNSRVNVFWGFGPLVRLARHHAEQTDVARSSSGDQLLRTTTDHGESWAAGAVGTLGVEWFATRAISLHAEYGFEIAYTWTESRRELRDPDDSAASVAERTADDWSVDGRQLLFGLSLYF